jgi:hypothetical protein
MRDTFTAAALALWAFSAVAVAHPRGAHKKVLVTLEAGRVGVLVALPPWGYFVRVVDIPTPQSRPPPLSWFTS